MEKWLWDDFGKERIRLSNIIKFNVESESMNSCFVYAVTMDDKILMLHDTYKVARMYVEYVTSNEED